MRFTSPSDLGGGPETICAICVGVSLLGRARAEEGRAVDAAVEARPALTVRELLLEPVEAAELAAEVVDRVHQGRFAGRGDHLRAVLELSVVGQDDVDDRLGEVGIEVLDALDLAADL